MISLLGSPDIEETTRLIYIVEMSEERIEAGDSPGTDTYHLRIKFFEQGGVKLAELLLQPPP